MRKFDGNPLNYFNEHFKDRDLTRSQLQKEDFPLYHALRNHKQLDEAIPKKYRNHDSPLDYFKKHVKDKGITKGQLSHKDNSLYQSLKRHKQFDEAFPRN